MSLTRWHQGVRINANPFRMSPNVPVGLLWSKTFPVLLESKVG